MFITFQSNRNISGIYFIFQLTLLLIMILPYVRSNKSFFDLANRVNNIKKIDLVIVRHAETIANRNNLLQGHCDYPLTQEGEEEAKILGIALSKIKWAKIFSSDLPRAFTTANYITQQSSQPSELIRTKLLREVCFGIREGLPRGTSVQEAKSIIATRESITDISMIKDNAESDAEVHHRQWKFLNMMINDLSSSSSLIIDPYPKVLVVTHGAFIRLFLREFCRLPKYDKIKNCSVTTIFIEFQDDGSRFSITVDENDVNCDYHLHMRNLPTEDLTNVYSRFYN